MEDKLLLENIKKAVIEAKEERGKNPHNVIVNIVDALIEAGLIDDDGNIINEPEKTGKEKK